MKAVCDRKDIVSLWLVALLIGIFMPVIVSAGVIPISQITEENLEKVVTIKGKITNVVSPTSDRAPYSYYVDDGTETVRVVVWRNIYAQIANPARFKIGEEVQVTGTVKKFRSSLEIHLTGASGISFVGEAGKAPATRVAAIITTAPVQRAVSPAAPAIKVKIGEVNKTFVGKRVTVEGTVSEYRESAYERAPNVVTLGDGGNSISVVFWQEVATKLTPAQLPEVGKRLEITGRVSEFNNQLQLRVYEAGDIKAAAPGK
jgi:DNA/RNA endonuclease YhcR with UshA esterase domain